MFAPSTPPDARDGFTLVELLFVMVVLGIVLGIGAAGVDRVDPGARGLQAAVSSFLEASRDRARSTGQPVVVQIEPPTDSDPARLFRLAYRPVLEASFEPRLAQLQGITLEGGARTDAAGRFGAALTLGEGSSAQVAGRGRRIPVAHGISLQLHLRSHEDRGAQILAWPGLLTLRQRRGGVVSVEIQTGGEKGSASYRITSPAGTLRPQRWHELRFGAADGALRLSVDGRVVAAEEWEGVLAEPDAPPSLGDPASSFVGEVDELTVWARVAESGPQFRDDVVARLGAPRLVYDRHGMLDPAHHAVGVPVEVVEFGEVVGRFTVGRFAEEETLP